MGIGKLGGVSTLTSLEALWSSGYQVDVIVFVEGGADGDGTGEGIRYGRGTRMPCMNMMVVHLKGGSKGRHQEVICN